MVVEWAGDKLWVGFGMIGVLNQKTIFASTKRTGVETRSFDVDGKLVSNGVVLFACSLFLVFA